MIVNRMELEQAIIEEGKSRDITVEEVRIYDRTDYLDFYVTIENAYEDDWTFKYDVKTLIDDMAPLSRPHDISEITIADTNRDFAEGDRVQCDRLWVNENSDIIVKRSSVCGSYEQGWVEGTVNETYRGGCFVEVIFDETVYYPTENSSHISTVYELDRQIESGDIQSIAPGEQIAYSSRCWDLRKPSSSDN